MPNIDTLKSKLTAIANAIRQKTGRSALLDLDEMPTEILSIDGGGGNVPNPDDPLLLVDWDGTLLYSYTYEDAQQISEFPDAPTHEGLTFQSWNWSEVVTKTWLQNHRGAQLKVGATYTPTDGQDHNFWRSSRLTEPNKIYMQHRATTNVWSDVFSNYRNLMNVSLPQGINTISGYAFNSCYSLYMVVLPSGVNTLGNAAFDYCQSLYDVIFPDSLINIAANLFRGCYNLRRSILPDGVTTVSANTFYNCFCLYDVVLPRHLVEIQGNAFYSCSSLPKIDVPASVTLIGNYAFNSCTSLVDVVIRGTPALGGSVVFDNNPSNQRFYVHRSDLSWFSTATNWSSIYGNGKIVAAADYIEYLQSIGVDTSDFEGE